MVVDVRRGLGGEVLLYHTVELVFVKFEIKDVTFFLAFHQQDKHVEHYHLRELEQLQDLLGAVGKVELLLDRLFVQVPAAWVAGESGGQGLWVRLLQLDVAELQVESLLNEEG